MSDDITLIINVSINIVQSDNNRHKISLIIFSTVSAYVLIQFLQPHQSHPSTLTNSVWSKKKKHWILVNVAELKVILGGKVTNPIIHYQALATGYSWFGFLFSVARTHHSLMFVKTLERLHSIWCYFMNLFKTWAKSSYLLINNKYRSELWCMWHSVDLPDKIWNKNNEYVWIPIWLNFNWFGMCCRADFIFGPPIWNLCHLARKLQVYR